MGSGRSAANIEDMEPTTEPVDADPPAVWEIRIGVHCTAEQARDLADGIAHLLCPDPEHTPPCPIPWSTARRLLDGQEAAGNYPELIEQARIEQPG